MVVITCGKAERYCPGVNNAPDRTYFYLFKYDPQNADKSKRIPEMTGSDLKLKGTRQDLDPQTGEAIVLMSFTRERREEVPAASRETLAERGRTQVQPARAAIRRNYFAAVRDRARPRDQARRRRSTSTRTRTASRATPAPQITGIGSIGEAKDLALVLQTGALPVNYVTIEQHRHLGDAR